MSDLDKLMYLAGVSADYQDYGGNYRTVSPELRLKILSLMGYPVDDPSQVADSVFELDARPWQSWLRSLTILTEGDPVSLSFHPGELGEAFKWELVLEEGVRLDGHFVPDHFPETGNYFIGPDRYSARSISLPPLPAGYHQLAVSCGSRADTGELVVCPPLCFDPGGREERLWGVTCQVYSLRSSRNWGIGDFLDLAELVERLAPLGADAVALNPLHAVGGDSPDAISPYSPSDRRFLNPLYIAPELVAEFLPADLDSVGAGELDALRQQRLVDYPAVGRIKYRLFGECYQRFVEARGAENSERATAFHNFVADGGQPLEQFCAHEAAHNPHAGELSREPRFFAYLQWLARSQLDHCQEKALSLGMKVGLTGDLAVGAAGEGNEVVSNPDLFLTGASIGAPPDPFSATGQDWGLPVINPVAMGLSHFGHFIRLLRTNMASVGALRIDHVMGLMRLWWCLTGDDGERAGAYVYYPFRELVSLLKLESHRCRCRVIGEDLGVVADELRQQIREHGLLGNTLFYFEQEYGGHFKAPEHHRRQAVLMVTNHDVPTLADWWTGGDLQRRRQLEVITEEEYAGLAGQRERDRYLLLNLLRSQGLLPAGFSPDSGDKAYHISLCHAIHRLCARSASRWLLVQLEDMQGMTDPVNIPGTHREYPNWRRKQASTTGDIFSDPEALALLETIQQERANGSSRAG